MKKKIITAVLGICLTTTAFGGILTTQAGGLNSILGGAAKIGGIRYCYLTNSVLKLTLS